jgi:hypothetical protein
MTSVSQIEHQLNDTGMLQDTPLTIYTKYLNSKGSSSQNFVVRQRPAASVDLPGPDSWKVLSCESLGRNRDGTCSDWFFASEVKF